MTAANYLRPQTLNEASACLAEHTNASLLAGGQSLLASMKLGLIQPSHLIDLQDIAELHDIRLTPDGLWIGAMVTHAQVANSEDVRQFSPMLCQLAGGIADPQVRHVGTLGGSLANNDPAACWPAGVLAHNATLVTTQRQLSAEAFFKGMFATVLQPNEILTGVLFPKVAQARYLKFEQPASRFALTGVAVARVSSQHVRVAVTGLGLGVMRWQAAENALQKRWHIHALHGLTLEPTLALSDLHASDTYRAHLAVVLCRRCVAAITPSTTNTPAITTSNWLSRCLNFIQKLFRR